MKKLISLIMIVLSFLVYLHDGRKGFIRDAVGFLIVEHEEKEEEKIYKVSYHSFFDKDGKTIMAVPSKFIKAVLYVREDTDM